MLALSVAVAANLRRPLPDDPTGSRAAALQAIVDTAGANTHIEIVGTYNFSRTSFFITDKSNVTLSSSEGTPSASLFLFGYAKIHSDMQTCPLHPGINISHSRHVTLRGAAIDYHPKARILFCANPRAPTKSNCSAQELVRSGPGITLHMYNASR